MVNDSETMRRSVAERWFWIALLVLFATLINYGRRLFTICGSAILFLCLLVWAQVVPAPDRWVDLMRSIFHA
jgi:hypothetical protein